MRCFWGAYTCADCKKGYIGLIYDCNETPPRGVSKSTGARCQGLVDNYDSQPVMSFTYFPESLANFIQNVLYAKLLVSAVLFLSSQLNEKTKANTPRIK